MEVAPSAPAPRPTTSARAASFEGDPRKWWALAVLLLAQVMIILDIAIVNVAVPSAQADLDIARADVQWVVTAYLLPFGGLLLLGGRIADYSGRKRVFCIATIGFAIASAIGRVRQRPGGPVRGPRVPGLVRRRDGPVAAVDDHPRLPQRARIAPGPSRCTAASRPPEARSAS